MNGYTILGAANDSAPRMGARELLCAVAPVVAGGVGVLSWPAHRVLGYLAGHAIGQNAMDFSQGQITLREAAENLGTHAVATASSLSLPAHPVIGYLAGGTMSGLLFRKIGEPVRTRIRETFLGLSAGSPSLESVREGRAVLKSGMNGEAVLYVQAIVGVIADGDYGPKTKAAVEAFQAKSGLSADGVVGKATMEALDRVAGGHGGVAKLDLSEPEKPAGVLAKAKQIVDNATNGATASAPTWAYGVAALGVALFGVGAYIAISD